MDKKVFIHTEYITTSQLLKLADFIQSGGESKSFLANNAVLINGVQDQRRGRKIYPGYKIEIKNQTLYIESNKKQLN